MVVVYLESDVINYVVLVFKWICLIFIFFVLWVLVINFYNYKRKYENIYFMVINEMWFKKENVFY